jgi:hypothetical protein
MRVLAILGLTLLLAGCEGDRIKNEHQAQPQMRGPESEANPNRAPRPPIPWEEPAAAVISRKEALRRADERAPIT